MYLESITKVCQKFERHGKKVNRVYLPAEGLKELSMCSDFQGMGSGEGLLTSLWVFLQEDENIPENHFLPVSQESLPPDWKSDPNLLQKVSAN